MPTHLRLTHLLTSFLFASLVAAFSFTQPAYAQAQVFNPHVEYQFGRTINFLAQINTDAPVKESWISIRSQGDADTIVKPVEIDSGGKLFYAYQPFPHPPRAFSQISYWFKLVLENGQEFTSPQFSFYYEDNRYNWQVLSAGPFRLHWYAGDQAYAQNILDIAQAGLQHIQTILPSFQTPDRIEIYVYDNATKMRDTLLAPGKNQIAGHADPDLGVMVVSLPPGPEQKLETERTVPHELTHIMLYQAVAAGYNNIPIWLNEGLASIGELYPNPDYQILLEDAIKKDNLMDISLLCQSFPPDMYGAQLSYAESATFTRYIYHQYGSSGLEALIGNYANGLDCSKGIEVSFGVTLTQLDQSWRKNVLNINQPPSFSSELLPWFALFFVILLVPLGLALVGLTRKKDQEDGAGEYLGA